jgi:hypothetical protein
MKTLQELHSWLLEEVMQFNIEYLRSLKDIEDVADYCLRTLGEPIGMGDYRDVWRIDNNRVIKVANAKDALVQNYNELNNSKCLGKHYSVEVYEHHPKFIWIIEEALTHNLDEKEFPTLTKKYMGIALQWHEFADWIWIAVDQIKTNKEIRDNYIKKTYETKEWFRGLIDGLVGCNIRSRDFHNGNWGIRPSTNEFIILDLGF